MLYTDKECDFILSQLVGKYLTDWESNFVASLQTQRKQGRKLSPKQVEALSKIWDK